MRPRAGIPSVLTLALTLVGAAFAASVPVVMAVAEPVSLPRSLGGDQHQDAETALYLLTFVVFLPLALCAGARVADRVAAGPNAAALSALAAALAGSLALAFVLARVLDSLTGASGEELALGAVGVWAVLAVPALVRAVRPHPWRRLLSLSNRSDAAWWVAGVVVFAALVALTAVPALSLATLAVAAVVAVAVLGARASGVGNRMPAGWGTGFDVAVVGLLLLAIPDLVVFRPEDAGRDLVAALEVDVIKFHHNLWLGPANQVLAGNALLVDASSQYGVAPLYLIAGWFQIAPIGYGTLALLDAALTAGCFAAGYAILRLAGTDRLLAAGAMAVAVLALVYNHVYPVGALPQQGPIRLGLPILLILVAVAGARFPSRERWTRWAELAVVGLSAIWSIEALAFTTATYAGLTLLAAAGEPERRLRWLARRAAQAVGACVAAHLLLAAITVGFAGELPDWGQYLAFLDAFLGTLGDITYDFSPWSPGLAVGAAILGSAAAVFLVVRRRPELLAIEGPALTALAGTSAYGVVLYSYLVDRSADHVLAYVSLPPLLCATLWIAFVLRRDEAPASARTGFLAFGLATGALMVAASWSSATGFIPRSALAHAPPGGKSLRDAMERLWDAPPLDPRSVAGERMLDRYMPGEREVLILLPPDLGLEILFRSGRASALPFGDPLEDSFVAEDRFEPLREAIAALRPGRRLLIERGGLRFLARGRRVPIGFGRAFFLSGGLVPLQQWALRRVEARFGLRPVARGPGGLRVVELGDPAAAP
jgi:hypothetical protein